MEGRCGLIETYKRVLTSAKLGSQGKEERLALGGPGDTTQAWEARKCSEISVTIVVPDEVGYHVLGAPGKVSHGLRRSLQHFWGLSTSGILRCCWWQYHLSLPLLQMDLQPILIYLRGKGWGRGGCWARKPGKEKPIPTYVLKQESQGCLSLLQTVICCRPRLQGVANIPWWYNRWM